MPAPQPGLFTVGHSNYPLGIFSEVLQAHTITAVADVRSSPYSRFNPQYNREALAKALAGRGIKYVDLGRELGARRSEPECYDGDKARYDLIARSPLFADGLRRVREGSRRFRVALLCAEKDPLDCHRSVLICRHLRHDYANICHILEGGALETQRDLETRLLDRCGLTPSDLFLTRDELVEQAYDAHGDRIAYVKTEAAVEADQ